MSSFRGVCTVLASAVILLPQQFWLVAASQVATAIAGAAIGPAVNGITLGIVRQTGFNRQIGHNQAFNHAGNVVGAGLSGLLGWIFGLPAVFWLAAVSGILSIVSVLTIPADAIDNRVNNLPTGLIAGATVQNAHVPDQITRAVLIGVDLGPDLSVTGSLATILWLTALRREGQAIGAGTFLKLGIVVTPPALLLAIGAALLVR
jgi:hypothetical protein